MPGEPDLNPDQTAYNFLAEGAGFEPARLSPNGFQDRRHRPLGHPSILLNQTLYNSLLNIFPSITAFQKFFPTECFLFRLICFVAQQFHRQPVFS
jgi:hypothetical protein